MKKIALGMMSGTSADGVSLVAAEFVNHSYKVLHYQTIPYPTRLQKQILKGAKLLASEISALNMSLGEFYARCTKQFIKSHRIPRTKIQVMGSHGQTIYHGPNDKPRNTLQIGEASVVSEALGIPVVSNFRMRDLAVGGQGAPLIPFFDQYFFGQNSGYRALQNIGGIANVTIVGHNRSMLAFDNGPGNCLIDLTIQKYTNGKLLYDRDGKLARQGRIDWTSIKKMYRHPYFQKKPPKSTGRELFNEDFIPTQLKKRNLKDQLATLTYFTAYSLFWSYQQFVRFSLKEVIISGGGVYNQTLMNFLQQFFAPIPVISIEKKGIPAMAKEPLAFAFFALRAFEGKINHEPYLTGAKKACVLGKIIPHAFH